MGLYGPVSAANPCRDDITRHCGDVQAGQGRVARCIAENREKFSAECQATMSKARDDVEALMVACREDRKRLCADVNPGRGRILRCMHEHRAEITPECRDELERVRADWQEN